MLNIWLPELDPKLSQGDVVQLVPMAPVVHPLSKLKRRSVKGVGDAYADDPATTSDSTGLYHLLARGPITDVIVLSHSCELDKEEKKKRVVVAQVVSAAKLEQAVRDVVFRRERVSLVPLVNVPRLGDCYADLRTITGVHRDHLGERIASIAPDGLTILREALVGFFVRDPADLQVRASNQDA